MPSQPDSGVTEGDLRALLLEHDSGKVDWDLDSQMTPSSPMKRTLHTYINRSIFLPLLIHSIIFIVYTFIFVSHVSPLKQGAWSPNTEVYYSPARDALELTFHTIDGLLNDSVFTRPPSLSVDSAWSHLLAGSNFRIYPNEASRLHLDSLALRDGSGYVGSLGVFHELHCINRLRRWLYKDYYYPEPTVAEFDEAVAHAHHCLETLRQSAMCHGDITVQPLEWLRASDGSVIGPTTKPGALHQCVDWDRLSEWAMSRRMDLVDLNILVKPTVAAAI